jgi:radical SAM/Cys-rich protein
VVDAAVKLKIKAKSVEILQLNITYKCNLACHHCHVGSSPKRTEMMSKETLQKCLQIIKTTASINTVDITGGAPEMNPHLEWFIKEVSKLNKRLLVRSNLVILLGDEYSHLIDVFSDNKVEIVGSLPCYLEENVCQQRGKGIFEQSIRALQILNQKGYGNGKSEKNLNLVYNPVGAYLPGPQAELEKDYKAHLKENYNISFDHLFCLTNMPIGRYRDDLERSGELAKYEQELLDAYNPEAVENVMCRTTISVRWDGKLYDCDFNQVLDLPIGEIDHFDVRKLASRDIIVGDRCFACVAGAGSSCQGALD